MEKAKKEVNSVDKAKELKNSHLGVGISALLSLIPGAGPFIDGEINKKINEFQDEKRNKLIDTILCNNNNITSEMVNDIEFIFNFSKTCEVVSKLATNDKVEYFGNLIKNSYLVGAKVENDVFEEYLNILNDMSVREINYLVFLKEKIDEMKTIKKKLKWHKFICDFEDKFNIPKENVYNIYYRLKRTGFVDEELSVSSSSVSGDEDIGYELDSADIDSDRFFLTNLFDDFYNKIINV